MALLGEARRRNTPLNIGGDGRCDSPEYSAKFGSYNVMDLDQKKVIDVQLVQVYNICMNMHKSLNLLCLPFYIINFHLYMQSNEVGGSYHMEEGYSQSVLFLQEQQLSIGNIITDHQKTIQKWIRNTLLDTTHLHDVWHKAKDQFIYKY